MMECYKALGKEPIVLTADKRWHQVSNPKKYFRLSILRSLVKRGWAKVNAAQTEVISASAFTEEARKEAEAIGRFIGAKKRYYDKEPEGQDLIDLIKYSKE